MIEPSQGSNPRDDVEEFLRKLRKVTAENEVLLCFDEVITGFRLSLGGVRELYAITPDLCTYGKTVGGGLPIGIVSGDNSILNYVSNGKEIMPTFFGGTFSANPLSMAVGNAVLSYLLENQELVYPKLRRQSLKIKNEINQFCEENKICAHMSGIESMMRLIFTEKKIHSRKERERNEVSREEQLRFYNELKNLGIYVGSNGIIFLSIAHDDNVVDEVIASFCLALKTQFKW